MKKLLVTSNFSFSHNVFHSYISLVRQHAVLCGNGLIRKNSDFYSTITKHSENSYHLLHKQNKMINFIFSCTNMHKRVIIIILLILIRISYFSPQERKLSRNHCGKRNNAGYQNYFLLFLQYFPSSHIQTSLTVSQSANLRFVPTQRVCRLKF